MYTNLITDTWWIFFLLRSRHVYPLRLQKLYNVNLYFGNHRLSGSFSVCVRYQNVGDWERLRPRYSCTLNQHVDAGGTRWCAGMRERKRTDYINGKTKHFMEYIRI